MFDYLIFDISQSKSYPECYLLLRRAVTVNTCDPEIGTLTAGHQPSSRQQTSHPGWAKGAGAAAEGSARMASCPSLPKTADFAVFSD